MPKAEKISLDLPKMSAAQRIEQGLLDEISVGALAPGQRLDETGLANRFGASRTPVREALSRLTAQGVLVQGEKRGVFVAEYSREELSQIFEAMHEIETACARIAAQRLTLLTRSEIEAAQANCVSAAEAGDRAAYLRANEAFHMTIYTATGNPYMAEIAIEFRRRTGPFRAKKFATRADLIASAKSHEALIADIFSEDSATASNSMRTHMAASFIQTLKAN
ncbi:GntR family transcriptional regulator [Pseudaestuariivita sp.]|uniref:GntR family transcriptional regulator n=1 Tax=Pseudaestuariivita sp. TaxID=2211669 RepID=UPI004059F633